jgi:2-polyprenyl-3-methyl-5-hydroxy-6-metoxy-1,4-benzoquinol methylase
MRRERSLYDRLRSLIFPFDAVLREVPDSCTLLDVGSGHGTFAIMAAGKSRNVEVTGVELSRPRIEKAKAKAAGMKNLNFVHCDFSKFSAGNKFDVVTCLDVMHHIPRELHSSVIERARELIRPGGTFILVEIEKNNGPRCFWSYMHDLVMARTTNINFIRRNEAIRMMKSGKFSVISVRDASAFMYQRYMIIAKAE